MLSLKKTLAFAFAILFAIALASGQNEKKSYVFKGTVTDVDPALGGHLKTGHMWSLQNRPTGRART